MSEPSGRHAILPFDPRLKAAMQEIKDVCTRYDIAMQAMVVSPTHSEFAWHFPSWSLAQFEGEGEGYGVRIRSKHEDFPSKGGQHAASEATAHMLMQWLNWHNMCLQQTGGLVEAISQVWDIEHTEQEASPHTEEGEAAAQDPRNRPLTRPERRRQAREQRKGSPEDLREW